MSDVLLPLGANLLYADDQFERFKEDPSKVDPTWRRLFENGVVGHPALPNGTPHALPETALWTRAAEIVNLVRAHRVRGHLDAKLDPLGTTPRKPHPDLDPACYGFTEADMDAIVPPGLLVGAGALTLREIYTRLREVYCGHIGLEYMHIGKPDRRQFLQERFEPETSVPRPSSDLRVFLLDRLILATELERFIQAKYVGTKRFSLEGSESLIPLIDLILDNAGNQGVVETVLGMAHRGRLNVLCNIMQMQATTLFSEFEDFDPETSLGAGDLKYHLGYSSEYRTRSGQQIHLSLAYNPSHLEAVDPVVVGRVRAKQRRRNDLKREKVLGLLIHGDAAFAGQGLVAETLNLSDLRGYKTGGTVHIIVNNQIGFTTAPTDSRSSPYPTDVARMLQTPILHVNGDDPEALARVAQIAMDYRKRFATDVVIDLFCFRRHGHNEVDDPSFTQPLLYERIKDHPTAYEVYGQRLVAEGLLKEGDVEYRRELFHQRLSGELEQARKRRRRPSHSMLREHWQGYIGGPETVAADVDTGVPPKRLGELGERISTIPEGFTAHPKIVRLLEQRAAMGRGERPIDWAMGEALAIGSLLWDGVMVRMSGQDTRRGTFSQRHAVIVDITNGAEHTPLASLHDKQAGFALYDSSLSEAAVVGFEYGFSLAYPDGLVLWEAQFGDFVNGAQVILDQFVTVSEDRWKLLSGLVLLLPHGYEGQGAEHSSCRFERFLQLAAEDNVQVAYPTTPAQYFHLLRRQVLRKWRKPLVVMTPKSLLRSEAATSSLAELEKGTFLRIIVDTGVDADAVERVMLCSGKLYFELVEERQNRKDKKTAIVRVEQLYPLQQELLEKSLATYPNAREWIWVQEEPANMGAYRYIDPKLRVLAGNRKLRAATRPESASPATGSAKAHQIEQRALIEEAFA